jgi:hypothetical protein
MATANPITATQPRLFVALVSSDLFCAIPLGALPTEFTFALPKYPGTAV